MRCPDGHPYMAAALDWVMAPFAAVRPKVIRPLSGRVLEIGVGTLNDQVLRKSSRHRHDRPYRVPFGTGFYNRSQAAIGYVHSTVEDGVYRRDAATHRYP